MKGKDVPKLACCFFLYLRLSHSFTFKYFNYLFYCYFEIISDLQRSFKNRTILRYPLLRSLKYYFTTLTFTLSLNHLRASCCYDAFLIISSILFLQNRHLFSCHNRIIKIMKMTLIKSLWFRYLIQISPIVLWMSIIAKEKDIFFSGPVLPFAFIYFIFLIYFNPNPSFLTVTFLKSISSLLCKMSSFSLETILMAFAST